MNHGNSRACAVTPQAGTGLDPARPAVEAFHFGRRSSLTIRQMLRGWPASVA